MEYRLNCILASKCTSMTLMRLCCGFRPSSSLCKQFLFRPFFILTSIFSPSRCDADPAALSKYVLALVKKDKPESELRDSMEQQMEVFLQESTTPFIDSLFKTLQSKEYLNGPPATKNRHDEENEEGKPDSTTSTPANVNELASDLKDSEHKSNHRSPDVKQKDKKKAVFWNLLIFYFLGRSLSASESQRQQTKFFPTKATYFRPQRSPSITIKVTIPPRRPSFFTF